MLGWVFPAGIYILQSKKILDTNRSSITYNRGCPFFIWISAHMLESFFTKRYYLQTHSWCLHSFSDPEENTLMQFSVVVRQAWKLKYSIYTSKLHTSERMGQQGHIRKCKSIQRKLKCTLGNSELHALAVRVRRTALLG